jgi:hypothetical protein
MTSYLSGPSLAAATGTRLDSAAKHIQQCRVSQDHMQELVTFDDQCDQDELIRNKVRYCVHKDELVLGIGKSWTQKIKFPNSAYPRVLSNLGRLADVHPTSGKYNEAIKMYVFLYHNATSVNVRDDILQAFQDGSVARMDATFPKDPARDAFFDLDPKNPQQYDLKNYVKYMYDYVPVGFANTVGWAHAHSGDTMTSVHIGGLRTVQNGHFEVFCGDLIQWYWPFERECFTEKGKRLDTQTTLDAAGNDVLLNVCPWQQGGTWKLSADAKQRKDFFDRQFGQKKGVEKHVPMIKPFKRDDMVPRIYDWYRVFAVAIASARPFEQVDIMIARQAM